MNSKALQLCKKLQELANRGVGGEATNAKRLLDQMLAKHNITLDDLEKPEKRRCTYDIMLRHQDLFWALVFNVVRNFDGKYWHNRASKRKITIELTYAEQLELTAKFDHYVRHYEKSLQLFKSAFIHKHRLYPNRTEDFDASEVTSKNTMSQEDLFMMHQLSQGITRKDFQQLLEDMSRLLE